MADAARVADVLAAAGISTLGEDASLDTIVAALRQLAAALNGADPLARSAIHAAAVVAVRDAGVLTPEARRMVGVALGGDDSGEEGRGQGRALVLSDPEPWPEPVDGSELLAALVGTLHRWLVLPDGGAEALALWTVHAHAHDAAEVSPILAVTSATARCGKSTVLHVLGALVPRPLPAANVTPATIYRAVEALRPTLLVDEADTFLHEREELRGVLNSGHHRAGALVVRTAGDDHEVRTYSTWAAKAVALIGRLPSTLADRSIEIRMRRRAPGESVERLRLDRLDDLVPVCRKAARWTSDQMNTLRDADPDVPRGLHDRLADSWRPLLGIADAAGGPWPDRARAAAMALAGLDDGEAEDVSVVLLHDLAALYAERGVDRLSSVEIVQSLGRMEDRPWPEWRRGQPLTTRQLAGLLHPHGIRPTQLWIGSEKVRGYARDAFREAWARYPAPIPPTDPVGAVDPNDDGRFTRNRIRYEDRSPTGSETGKNPMDTGVLPDLPDGDPPPAESRALPDLFRVGVEST